MGRFGLAVPYIAAILLYIVAPLLSRQVKAAVRCAIESGQHHHAREVREEDIPYVLTTEFIDDYIDFAVDAVQVFPVFLLPIVGAIYAFSTAVPAEISSALLLITIVFAIGMSAWVNGSSPVNYASRKWHGYALIPVIGVIFNTIALALVLALS